MTDLKKFLVSMEALVSRLEDVYGINAVAPDWQGSIAFRWRIRGQSGRLESIEKIRALKLDDIRCVEAQKTELIRNTRQFVQGLAANNALLWGSRGIGKSSLIKALLVEFCDRGLRIIEVDKQQLIDLPDILSFLYDRPEKFILFCDDLSFEADEPSYKALKAALDGSLCGLPDNVLIYATSNRRHLLPEFQEENLQSHHVGGELHHGESVEEKISLSERFGLWVSFHPFTQDQYLSVVKYWLRQMDVDINEWRAIRSAALQWALMRGSRSGRVAWQFARDYSGRVKSKAARIESSR